MLAYLYGAAKVTPICVVYSPIKAGLQPWPPCLSPVQSRVAILYQVPHHPLRLPIQWQAQKMPIVRMPDKALVLLVFMKRQTAHLELHIGLLSGVGEVILQVDEHARAAMCVRQVSAVL